MKKSRVERSLKIYSSHVPNQLFPLCVCLTSSKSNIFQGKEASQAKIGQNKKQKFHEMLDLLCFQSQNL